MKILIFSIAMTATNLMACNTNDNKASETTKSEVTKDTLAQQSATADTVAQASTGTVFPVKEIIGRYLQVKNALAKDNSKDAANAGNELVASLAQIDPTKLSPEQQKSYTELADDLNEHAEHIGSNPGKIEHQREHFMMMSKDIADLVKTFGNAGQTLYKDFCPMANDGKGATWISEVKEIKNPYLGSKMPDCGTLKETIK
ncbi:MAG: hypothetical protein JWQ27_17 [Ferruginibacter sp.]|nr:hypothetical protein [Ferruginibacter sp.]